MADRAGAEGALYETCFACSGSGVEMVWTGADADLVTCSTCRGDCVLRIRDERGRFVPAVSGVAASDESSTSGPETTTTE